MHVWVLEAGEDSDRYAVAVFSTESAAHAYRVALTRSYPRAPETFNVKRCRLDPPLPSTVTAVASRDGDSA